MKIFVSEKEAVELRKLGMVEGEHFVVKKKIVASNINPLKDCYRDWKGAYDQDKRRGGRK